MDEYLCAVCSKACDDDIHDTIQCSSCQVWVHNTCTNLSKSDLKQWSADYLQFLCKLCAFSGTTYNSEAALNRLRFTTKSKTRLQTQAKSESKLLQTYDVQVPINDSLLFTSSQIDQQSVEILNMFHPVMNIDFSPLTVAGDGNCLYRAVSLGLTGSQENHIMLRLMTALELINNRQYYDTKKKHNDFLNDTRIMTSEYEKLVYDALTDRHYSEMAHIYALSAAPGIVINSYYPPQLNTEISSAFTRKVCGRKVRACSKSKIYLMWTSACAPSTPKAFHVNHFVRLVKKNVCLNDTIVVPSSDIGLDEKFDDFSETDVLPDASSVPQKLAEIESSLHCSNMSMHEDDEWDRSDSGEMYASSLAPSSNIIMNEVETQPLSPRNNLQKDIHKLSELNENDAVSSESDLPSNESETLSGKLENRYLDAGKIAFLLSNNKTGLPRIPGGNS